jgi:hypothetical protein
MEPESCFSSAHDKLQLGSFGKKQKRMGELHRRPSSLPILREFEEKRMMLVQLCQRKNVRRKSTQGELLVACVLFSAAPSSLSAQVRKLPVPNECKAATQGLMLYQRNYPAKTEVYSAVDLYCNQKGQQRRVAQNVTLCDSNYNGSEQKVIVIAVAPAKAAKEAAVCTQETELTLVPHGTGP